MKTLDLSLIAGALCLRCMEFHSHRGAEYGGVDASK